MRQSHQNSSGDAIRGGGGYKVEQQRSVCVFLLAHHIPHSQLAQEEVGGWGGADIPGMRKDPSEAGSGGPGDQGWGHAAEECGVAAGGRKEAVWGSGNFAGVRIMPARKLGGQLCA